MTIKIEAWQSRGIKTDKVIDRFDFCCWEDLNKWLNNPSITLHRCPKCKEEYEKDDACEEHKGNWHLKCKQCYANYSKSIDERIKRGFRLSEKKR